MNRRLEDLFANFLASAGSKDASYLGKRDTTVADKVPDTAAVDRFLRAMDECRQSSQRAAWLLFAAYLILLLGVLVMLFLAQAGRSSASMVALLGGSGVAGLVVIPVRMQSLWKDLALMQLTLLILPGQSPEDQLALIKAQYAAGRSRGLPAARR